MNTSKVAILKERYSIRKLCSKGYYIEKGAIRFRFLFTQNMAYLISVPKSLGNAVKRNYVKRVLREVIRRSQFPINMHVLILLKRKQSCHFSFREAYISIQWFIHTYSKKKYEQLQ